MIKKQEEKDKEDKERQEKHHEDRMQRFDALIDILKQSVVKK